MTGQLNPPTPAGTAFGYLGPNSAGNTTPTRMLLALTTECRPLPASRLPWLPSEATDRFAASGCRQAIAAIGQPGHLVLIAADGSGERLGFMHATVDESVLTAERVGYVSVVVVTASAGGTGVGRRLMLDAEEWARQQDCALMTLEVFAQNTTARAVYTRLGYQEQTLRLAKPL